MLLGGYFSDEIPRKVLSCGFLNPRRTHVEDEEVWLDVANSTHVRPEVWAAAGA